MVKVGEIKEKEDIRVKGGKEGASERPGSGERGNIMGTGGTSVLLTEGARAGME